MDDRDPQDHERDPQDNEADLMIGLDDNVLFGLMLELDFNDEPRLPWISAAVERQQDGFDVTNPPTNPTEDEEMPDLPAPDEQLPVEPAEPLVAQAAQETAGMPPPAARAPDADQLNATMQLINRTQLDGNDPRRIGPSQRYYQSTDERREQRLLSIVIGLRDLSGNLVPGTDFFHEEPFLSYGRLKPHGISRIKPTKDALEEEVSRRCRELLQWNGEVPPFRKVSDAVAWLMEHPITHPCDIQFFSVEIWAYRRKIRDRIRRHSRERPREVPEDIRTRYTADDVQDTDIVRGHLELVALQHSIEDTERVLRAECQAFLDLPPDMLARRYQAQENILRLSIALAEYKQAFRRVAHRRGW